MPSDPELLALYDEQMRRRYAGTPSQRVERSILTTRTLGEAGGLEWGCVIFSALEPRNADAAIDGELQRFGAIGRAFEWKAFGHDRPADLEDRLTARGFRPGDRETLVVRESEPALERSLPEGLRMRRLQSPDECGLLARYAEAAGEAPNEALVEELRHDLATTPEALSIWLVMDGETPVARGWSRFYPQRDFADLWGGHTLPAYRRRGLYQALVARRLAEVRERGVRYVTTDARASSRPLLERMGFRPLTTVRGHLWVPMG